MKRKKGKKTEWSRMEWKKKKRIMGGVEGKREEGKRSGEGKGNEKKGK